jgi:hypothetical protein
VKEGLRVIWTYRIGRNLLPTGSGCHGNHRRRRKGEGDCQPKGVASGAGVTVATRGGRRRGRVGWKVPDRHAVLAHQPNNIYLEISFIIK